MRNSRITEVQPTPTTSHRAARWRYCFPALPRRARTDPAHLPGTRMGVCGERGDIAGNENSSMSDWS